MKGLEKLWERGKNFLGSEFAIMGGAMSWVSEHNLVSAISNAGGFGVLACGSMKASDLAKEIDLTRSRTDKNFGVNLIVMHPDMDELIALTIEKKLTHVVLAGGMPKSKHLESLKAAKIKTLAFAPALIAAKKLIRMGIDALIIEGMEAGGHIGPVSTSVLAQEILPTITEVPIFVAGGIGSGHAIAAFLFQGASGCQLGTLFVCTNESIAHENFKRAFINASARDAVSSVQIDHEFPVIPVRAIANKASIEFAKVQRDSISKFHSGEMTKDEAKLAIEHFWAGALRKAVIDGDIENGSLMAGQSVGMVKDVRPVKSVIGQLLKEANEHLEQYSVMYS